jgi:hypothetical protein
MKAISATALVLTSAFAIHLAVAASGPDRPAGVEYRDWIPVSDKMGFVVTTPHTYPLPAVNKQPLLLTPPAVGYFMVCAGDGWQRIAIKDPLKGPGSAG